MADRRKKDVNWCAADENGETQSFEAAQLAVLMDIRDELKALNAKAGCYRIPRALDAVYRMHRDGVKRRVVRKRK